MSQNPFTLERDDDIAVVVINRPGEAVNSLDAEFAPTFLNLLEELCADSAIRAIVLISGKKDNFIAGADIKMLDQIRTIEEGISVSKQGQDAMQRIQESSKPVVAAIHGACLGGGLELALACHARVASDHPKTKLGLPEVQLGLIPGAGGTQRLPRLIGLQASLDLILTGKQLNAKKAMKLSLIDELVPPPLLRKVAVELARSLALTDNDEQSPMQVLGESLRSLASGDELQGILLEENPLGRKVLFDQARKRLLKKTRGNYPAPERALDAIALGAGGGGLEAGYEAEANAFGELLQSGVSKQLVGIFLASNELKKDSGLDEGEKADMTSAPEFNKVAVLGAGLMGAGISYVTSKKAKLSVRLKDRDADGVGQGLKYVKDIVSTQVKRRRTSKRDALELMSRIHGTTTYQGFSDTPVVIEAVFEDLELKRTLLKSVEEVGPDKVIFASNTSTLPISKIAEASIHPETVVGMHYFSPVHKMPLLEIIRTEQTAPWVVARCVELGKAQGKTVIVVRDGVGFYTSRILAPYMNEAMHILSEGTPMEVIDRALMDYGFPVGPVKLLDEVGIDVASKAGGVVKQAFGNRIDAPEGMEALITDGRHGRKNEKGMYDYSSDKATPDESVYALLGIKKRQHALDDKEREDIALRCTLQMINEAAHCLGEGILRNPRDGDIGAIFGLGFPPFLGGPFRALDEYGAGYIVGKMRNYAERWGTRFEPAPLLVEHAESKRRFYPQA